jgi:TPR repeat protein
MSGEGVEKDRANAVRLFGQAADQGNANARLQLGWCYEHGQGIGQNASAAVEQYRLAAEAGDKIATTSLGLCFEKVRGVPRGDAAEAARLYALAAEDGTRGETAFTIAMAMLPDSSLAPYVPSAAALVRTRHAVHHLNLAARLGHVPAAQQLEALAGRRNVVCAAWAAARCTSSRRAPSAASRASATGSAPRTCGRRTRRAARRSVPKQWAARPGAEADGSLPRRANRVQTAVPVSGIVRRVESECACRSGRLVTGWDGHHGVVPLLSPFPCAANGATRREAAASGSGSG